MEFRRLAYRPEIDGLRAIAVLTVVIYHANLGFMGGGFVGVDVFFVLSGFLISSIILEEGSRGAFSYWTFYKRRILRIFPALFTMIAACIAFGWIWFPPVDYKRFADTAIAAAAFYSNFYFYDKSDYFAPDAITQPLLHTWSLGVEEQFYIVAPFLLLAFLRYPKVRILGFVVLFLASLAFSVIALTIDQPLAFYMLPSRTFELMTGAALALGFLPRINSRRIAEVASIAGLALILAPALFYTHDTPFPGFAALLPCFGTMLVIHANTEVQTATGRILSSGPFVFFGKISYSLYLWHWPFLAFGLFRYGEDLGAQWVLGLLVGATFVSYLSYRFIEQPVRHTGNRISSKRVAGMGVAAILVCVGLSLAIRSMEGLPSRLPPAAAAFVAANPLRIEPKDACRDQSTRTQSGDVDKGCAIGALNAPETFLFFGDSHAESVAAQVAAVAAQNGMAGYMLARSGCPPILNLERLPNRIFRKCVSRFSAVDDILVTPSIKTVILYARWARYDIGPTPNEPQRNLNIFGDGDPATNRPIFQDMVKHTVRTLRDRGLRVVIIAATPEAGFNVQHEMTKNLMTGAHRHFTIDRTMFDDRQREVNRLLEELGQEDGVEVLYPGSLYCDGNTCKAEKDGMSLYTDDNHLSPTGAALLTPIIEKAIRPSS